MENYEVMNEVMDTETTEETGIVECQSEETYVEVEDPKKKLIEGAAIVAVAGVGIAIVGKIAKKAKVKADAALDKWAMKRVEKLNKKTEDEETEVVDDEEPEVVEVTTEE